MRSKSRSHSWFRDGTSTEGARVSGSLAERAAQVVVRAAIRYVLLALACLLPSTLTAQSCTTFDPPCPANQPPSVSIQPLSASAWSVSQIDVTIYVADDRDLDAGSWQVTLAGATDATGHGFPLVFNSGAQAQASNRISLQSGSGNIVIARICDEAGLCAADTASYTYNPPPPAPQKATPVLSLAPHHGELRDASRCADCLGATMSYATPAYMSLDAPRSVALLYSSAHARPRALVQVDAFDNSLTPPSHMSLRLRWPDQSYASLTTGGTEVFYSASNDTNRLAAQLAADTLLTGAYDLTAVVRSWWGAEWREATIPVRILVVNEVASELGWGWTMPGLQRLRVRTSDNAIVLTEGDGSILFFARQSCDGSGNCAYLSPDGDFSELRYTTSSGKYTRRAPDGVVATFDGSGRLESIADRFGNVTTFGHTAGQLTSVTDPAGKVITLGYGVNGIYGAPGRLAWIRDPAGRTTDIRYDAAGNVSAIRDPDGVEGLRASYDGDHRVISQWDRTNAQTDFAYDVYGGLASVTAPQVSTTDAGVVRLVTVLRSLPAAVLPASGRGGSAANAGLRVHPDSAWISETSPRGASSRMRVDRFGSPVLLEERDPRGVMHMTRWSYDSKGRLTSQATAKGATSTYRWTGPDVVEMNEPSAGRRIELAYEAAYHQVSEIRQNGTLILRNFYGVNGRLDSAKVDTAFTRYTYDGRGRILTMTDPEGHRTTMVYQTTGFQNTQSITVPGGSGGSARTSYSHDAYGRVQSATDQTNRTVSFGYDLLNRKTRSVGFVADTTLLSYDDPNRTFSITDAKGHIYRTVRNGVRWVDTRTDPRGGVERFAYDRNGNLTRYTNRRGGVVSFSYDSLDRVLTRVADGQTTTFSYDTAQRWVAVSNAESTDTLRTDAEGRPDEAISVRAGQRTVVRTSYDYEGMKNAIILQGSWGQDTVEYGFTSTGRVRYLKDLVATFGTLVDHDEDDLRSRVRLPTGTGSLTRMEVSTAHTAAHAPSRITYTQGADQTLGRRYGYDELSRITRITSGAPNANPEGADRNEIVRSVTYDAGGRISGYSDVRYREVNGGTICPDPHDFSSCYKEIITETTTLRAATYTYDKVGNRSDRSAVTEATSNRVTSVDGYTISYDADGNITRKLKAGVWDQTFVWNSLAQLTQVTTNGIVTTFGYDGWGRRVRKTTAGTNRRYVHDGDDLVAELDGSGNPILEYAFYPGTDRPHSVRRRSDGAIFYYATELPGHVAGLVSATNQIVNKYEYTPFGEVISATEGVAQPLRFTAREYDAESKLYYYRARYYDPHLSRFVSEDPIGLEGGINPYVYASNDPVNRTDPLGLDDCVSVKTFIIETDGSKRTTWTRICRGGGSVIGQILDWAATIGVGSGSAFWGGGVFATPAAVLRRASMGPDIGLTVARIREENRWQFRGCPIQVNFRDDRLMQHGTLYRLSSRTEADDGAALYSGDIIDNSWSPPRLFVLAFGRVSCQTGAGFFAGGYYQP
jgi:RHS repeat-associated protein